MAETPVSLFLARAARHPDRAALRVLAAGGAERDESVTWGEWAETARRFAAALVDAGHQPGDAVAVFAGNGLPWPVADLGTLLAGGVAVGLYPTSPATQVAQVLADCGASVVVCDTAERLAILRAARAASPAVRTLVSVAPGRDAVRWDAWLAGGGRALAGPAGEEVGRRAASAGPADLAALIYTSGSTGQPKGARIPHRNLLASARSIAETLGLGENDSSLSFLPFCHAAERVFGLHTRIVTGMEAGLVEDHVLLWDALRAFRPTLFGGLPRLYEKAHGVLVADRARADGATRERWDRALDLGRQRSRLRRAGEAVPAALDAEWVSVSAPMRERAAELFGGRMRLATSGGATLPVAVAEDLDALGITVLGGYGLTEHLCAAFHRPDRYGFDSAGPPMPGTELRIGVDGEILVRRSDLTFDGYHGRPTETAEAFTVDGEWLLTGDLGSIGADGALRVTGRKKELIALSGGKKVAPLPIEEMLSREPWIARAVLHGEGRRFVSALLCLRAETVAAWTEARALRASAAEVLDHPELVAEVQGAVDRVNAGLSNPERVRRFVLLPRDLSVAEGELTPTLKVRRPVVAERFADALDALYR